MLEDSYGSYIVACEEDLLGGWGFLLPFPSSPPPTPQESLLAGNLFSASLHSCSPPLRWGRGDACNSLASHPGKGGGGGEGAQWASQLQHRHHCSITLCPPRL